MEHERNRSNTNLRPIAGDPHCWAGTDAAVTLPMRTSTVAASCYSDWPIGWPLDAWHRPTLDPQATRPRTLATKTRPALRRTSIRAYTRTTGCTICFYAHKRAKATVSNIDGNKPKITSKFYKVVVK